MALFRKHRGQLIDSLKTTIIVNSLDDLRKLIQEGNVDIQIKVEAYPHLESCFDKRIGWYTHIVLSDRFAAGEFQPEGFLSEPLI